QDVLERRDLRTRVLVQQSLPRLAQLRIWRARVLRSIQPVVVLNPERRRDGPPAATPRARVENQRKFLGRTLYRRATRDDRDTGAGVERRHRRKVGNRSSTRSDCRRGVDARYSWPADDWNARLQT